ncbi:hypothetical protein Tco_0009187 [Tanacetum coccineum]
MLLKELNDINTVDSLEKAKKGDWIVDPNLVKNKFFTHFSNRFSKPGSFRICLVDHYTKRLSSDQKEDLERNVTLTRSRVRSRTVTRINFLVRMVSLSNFFLDIEFTEQDIMADVSEFFSSGAFPSGCNSSFISLITKIHDAKFVRILQKSSKKRIKTRNNSDTGKIDAQEPRVSSKWSTKSTTERQNPQNTQMSLNVKPNSQ